MTTLDPQAGSSQLFGSCACERNQYTILLPPGASVQVFFDNSVANRRPQATPLTAWLRVPLAYYHSHTRAQFPDESHASIRRTFHTPTSSSDEQAVIRRQFCGYCGTHLSAWDEQQSHDADDGDGGDGSMDITLGSLAERSLRELEELGALGPSPPASPAEAGDVVMAEEGGERQNSTPAALRHRGVPFFESLVDDSDGALRGRIRRAKGGHTSLDGRTTVEWEVVELDDNDNAGGGDGEQEGRSKRPRLEG